MAPNIATLQEQGVKGFDINGWYAILAPAGTPKAIVDRMSQEIATAVADPKLKEQLAASGYVPVGSTPEQLGKHIDSEIVGVGVGVGCAGPRWSRTRAPRWSEPGPVARERRPKRSRPPQCSLIVSARANWCMTRTGA